MKITREQINSMNPQVASNLKAAYYSASDGLYEVLNILAKINFDEGSMADEVKDVQDSIRSLVKLGLGEVL